MSKPTPTNDTERSALNTHGMKATSQRALILGIIRQGEGHLDADEVYRQARERLPTLSLSTVYRTLHMFKEAGLVQEVRFSEEHHHYEPRPASEHHHLTCLRCGRVIEFHYPLSRYIKRDIAAARDFQIVNSEVYVRGYCQDCRQKETSD